MYLQGYTIIYRKWPPTAIPDLGNLWEIGVICCAYKDMSPHGYVATGIQGYQPTSPRILVATSRRLAKNVPCANGGNRGREFKGVKPAITVRDG